MSERAEFHVAGKPYQAEPLHYTASGLDYVYLRNGFTVESDPDYGKLISIDDVDDLHRAIGMRIISQPRKMTSAEFRFLRKQMKLTQKQLASRLGVNEQTVANYEKNKPIKAGSENLMRVTFLLWIVPPDVSADVLKQIVEAIQAPSDVQKAQASKIVMPPHPAPATSHPDIVKQWHVGGMLTAMAKDSCYAH